jgi:phosphomannomutase
MAERKTPVKFGTDGWRAIFAEDFTFANVRVAAAAIANYVLAEADGAKKGVGVAYDTRFGSRMFARAVAEVLAGAGVPVQLADRITSTPALSYAVKDRGLAGGVMITSSHNPPQWNGVKYKAYYGGAGDPAIIAAIETYLEKPLPAAAKPAAITEVNFLPEYLVAVKAFVDLKKIAAAKFKYLIDPLYGTACGQLKGIFDAAGVESVEIRNVQDPLFPGINPEPILPNIQATCEAVVQYKCAAGLITDGDADRIGAVDEHGKVVTSHMIFAVILKWLLDYKKWPGAVTRAYNTTLMLDRICAKYGRKLYEHGIGFKYVTDLMLQHEILIGGEESGGIGIARHLPERDGLLNSLIIANVMADENKTLGQLVTALQAEFGVHEYGRVDMHINDTIKNDAIRRAKAGVAEFGGMKVLRSGDLDGIKFFLEDKAAAGDPKRAETWLLLRASGTEPLLRVYCEGPSQEIVQKVLKAAQAFVLNGAKG